MSRFWRWGFHIAVPLPPDPAQKRADHPEIHWVYRRIEASLRSRRPCLPVEARLRQSVFSRRRRR